MQPERHSFKRQGFASASGSADTVVTFATSDGLFALPVARVVEILDIQPISPLPRSPDHMLGLIDRRGVSVPVVDMRLLLGFPLLDDTPQTRIVVLKLGSGQDTDGMVGLRVDRVIEVTTLDPVSAEDTAPATFLDWNEPMVAGIGRRDGKFITRLDIEEMFTPHMAHSAQVANGLA